MLGGKRNSLHVMSEMRVNATTKFGDWVTFFLHYSYTHLEALHLTKYANNIAKKNA